MKLKDKKGTKNSTGADGEKYARHYLRLHGYRIIAANAEFDCGEIDIIASKRGIISFVEVKTRTIAPTSAKNDRPADAVNYYKRKTIVKCAERYLHTYPTSKHPTLDIIEVYIDPKTNRKYKINHIKSAFNADCK